MIPALNEEDAIGGIISRCLAAREHIKEVAGLAQVEIIVVSDGSTDRTAEIAESFEDVKVIVFEKNRGYGAAIKEGWRQGQGSLLGFLDADGTCDPTYFAEMCRVAVEESADVVLGARLGAGIEDAGDPEARQPPLCLSARPALRPAGDRRCQAECASSAAKSLKWLYPLPDGLHFTPSMSARALLNDLRLTEVPMQYEERIGRSKLHVLRDGVRFLQTIFSGVLCYRPEKLLLTMFMLCLVFLVLFAAYPVEFYFQNRRLEEWMIYRFVVCYLLGSFGLMLLLATALMYQMAAFGPRADRRTPFGRSSSPASCAGGCWRSF